MRARVKGRGAAVCVVLRVSMLLRRIGMYETESIARWCARIQAASRSSDSQVRRGNIVVWCQRFVESRVKSRQGGRSNVCVSEKSKLHELCTVHTYLQGEPIVRCTGWKHVRDRDGGARPCTNLSRKCKSLDRTASLLDSTGNSCRSICLRKFGNISISRGGNVQFVRGCKWRFSDHRNSKVKLFLINILFCDHPLHPDIVCCKLIFYLSRKLACGPERGRPRRSRRGCRRCTGSSTADLCTPVGKDSRRGFCTWYLTKRSNIRSSE